MFASLPPVGKAVWTASPHTQGLAAQVSYLPLSQGSVNAM
ncbi:hypothetical protein SAMN05421837_11457 [Amycolatopsis pretoriensis]|uniref:Uncharacterized protein n=1 Tax=Amycolatopsis pretoriensis TaxID=218821 RepID=A0A1H5RIY8_9PSEU|nr:hypothetical protein SAMN05421837_11457 [Amycolatopsis pretoriensis]